jgi:hypothetical protein
MDCLRKNSKNLLGKARLLFLTVLIAFGATSQAIAADLDVVQSSAANAQGTPLVPANAGADVLQNLVLTNVGGDFATINIDTDGGAEQIVASANFDVDTTLFIDDATATTTQVLVVTGVTDVATGASLTVVLGSDGVTAGGDTEEVGITFTGAVTGGGTIAINAVDGAVTGTAVDNSVLFSGAVTLDALTLRASDSAAAAGGDLTITDIGTGGDAVAVTTINLRAGNGTTANETAAAGGDLLISDVQGVVTGTTFTIAGGAGGTGGAANAGGAGGAVVITDFTTGSIASTTLNFNTGNGGSGNTLAGADGGALTITNSNVAITSTTINIVAGTGGNGELNVAGGDAGAGGDFGVSVFTTLVGATGSTLNVTGGAAGTAGAGTATAGGDAGAGGNVNSGLTFTGGVTGTMNFTGGAGSSAGAAGAAQGGAGAAGGAVVITEITAAATGNMTLTGGAGGSGADGAVAIVGTNGAAGGLVTVTDINTSLTGDLTILSGAGGDGGTAGTTGAGGNGAVGGAILVTSIDAYAGSAATGGAVSITAGAGGAGGAGSATAAGNGGLAAAGGAATVTMDTGSADISTLTITAGAGGTGGAGGFTGSTSRAGGTAGTAALTITGTAAEITSGTFTGGAGGAAGASNTLVGITGTIGGTSTVTIDVAVTAQGATGTSELTVIGGAGGAGGDGSATFAGVAGVAGGSSTLDFGTTAAVAANITLNDGATGATGATNTLAGGTGGTGGSAILSITAAKTLTGNVTAASDGEGTINTSGGLFTMAGDIGTSTASVLRLNVGNVAGMTTNGSIYADGIDLNATDAPLAFTNTTTAQVVSGTIEGAGTAASTSDINANAAGGTVTFNGAVGRLISNASTASRVDTITTGTGTTTFASNVDAQTLVVGAGTVSFNDLVTVTGVASVANTATITLATGIVAGETVMTSTNGGAALITTGATVNMPEAFTSGTIILHNDASDTAGQATADAAKITFGSNVLSTYTAQVNAADVGILEVVASKKSSSTIAANLGISAAAASALDGANTALAGATSSQDVATLAALNAALAAGGATAAEAAEQMQGSPANLSAAGSAAVSATGSQVIAVGSSRLASLRSGAQFASSQASGFAGGADANDYGVWMKPFVNFGDQNQRTGIAGYETETYGMALGGDVKVGDSRRTTIGGSFSYSFTDIDSKGAGNAQTDIDGFQGTLYADYTTNEWYVEGLVGYARNEIDTSRSITAGALTATADYGSNQFMVNIGGGMPMEIAKNHFFTPNASFQYTLVENETYTEEGAGAMNLRVDQDEVHIAMGIFGARYHTHTEFGGGAFTPEIRTALTYDFAGDEGQSTSTFNGGGAAFSVQGADVVQLGYTAGLGLSYAPLEDQGLTISANYDWNQKTDFVGHSGNFALRYEF